LLARKANLPEKSTHFLSRCKLWTCKNMSWK